MSQQPCIFIRSYRSKKCIETGCQPMILVMIGFFAVTIAAITLTILWFTHHKHKY
ncbi:hypothetical protein PCANB_000547 [Pneumocystis canis]|nr:hypothetical protein PCANB_000547 [Pneumocystis canis]